jgi:hypothetical protein
MSREILTPKHDKALQKDELGGPMGESGGTPRQRRRKKWAAHSITSRMSQAFPLLLMFRSWSLSFDACRVMRNENKRVS